jgi:hypothetical protein
VSTPKLCACDRSCQSLICAEIELIDTVKQPYAVLVKNLSDVEKTGLWLNPFRGIPRGQRLSRFDVIYLDDNCKVLEFAENFTVAEFEPFRGETATALILPPHTLNSFQIRKTDQLQICIGRKQLNFAHSTLEDSSDCVRDIGQQTSHAKALREHPHAVTTFVEEKPSLKLRLLRWLFDVSPPTDRRRAERLPTPALLAYYWNGGEPKGHRLANVSESGLYLLTEERWLPGTRIVMTLQKRRGEIPSEEISRVESRVVRWGEDGIGCEFVRSEFVDLNSGEIVDRKFDQQAFGRFLQGLQSVDSGVDQPTVN